MPRFSSFLLLASCASLAASTVHAQQQLPAIEVTAPAKARPKPPRKLVHHQPSHPTRAVRARVPAEPVAPQQAPTLATTPTQAPPSGSPSGSPLLAPSTAVVGETAALDAARASLTPRTGANAYDLGRQAIEARPQGDNAPFEKLVLQLPGVTQDSAASGDFHIRNEHANVQYRINGILLPDGVSGFSQILDTSFIGSLALLDGVLPAQYGLRTSAVIDITTRSGIFDNGGSLGFYGGSHNTLQPTVSYGGTVGETQFFMTGRFNRSDLGIENPTSSHEAVHDATQQGRFFGYVSSNLNKDTRLTFITGTSISGYQIPNSPGQMPQFTAYGVSNLDSLGVNENQVERNFYNVLALQRSVENIDAQLSYFSRYSTLHFVPDPVADLVFNGISSNVLRESLVNGVQGDVAYRAGTHTLRFGVQMSVERTNAANANIVLPTDAMGNPIDAPFTINDASTKTGYLGSVYAQDEWRLTNQLTLNGGLRFDEMAQYVTANQLSPRVALVFTPLQDTVTHIGYARYFTPPQQVLSAPTNLAAYANTTGQPAVTQNDPVRPERADYFDAGVTQKILPGLSIGADAYYKRARNLIDDGQFGQALVLTTFNYDRAYNTGVELKANYDHENLHLYGNFAWGRQRATQVSSNQYLFDPATLAYIADHYIYTDHAQVLTASAGASYKLFGTRISADLVYGSGLRDGFANTGTVTPYAQVNLGLSREFKLAESPGVGPLTLRFDIINLFDRGYEIRDGSGIGVFAPQYGQRRSFLAGLSQKF